MKEICFVTNKYPNKFDPNVLVFLQQLIWEIAEQGVKCTVICPMPVNLNLNYFTLPYKTNETTDNGEIIKVYRPKYFGLGQKSILSFNTANITTDLFTLAVKDTIKKLKHKPDVLYAHFVTPAGIAVARLGKRLNIPAYLAYGEATYGTIEHFGFDKVAKELKGLAGVIAVSSKNKNMLVDKEIVGEDKIAVFPNGYRKERFFPRNKFYSRTRLGLPEDKFLISFVGSYDNRKGIRRLVEAVESLNIKDIGIMSAGSGMLNPSDSIYTVFDKVVDNSALPYFYSASDVFVLPTLNEGCSNAIVEAIASGLPVISSDLPFNNEIMDSTNSIKIDPSNVDEIRAAIKYLYDNTDEKNRLAIGSMEKAKELTINIRAEKILKYIFG